MFKTNNPFKLALSTAVMGVVAAAKIMEPTKNEGPVVTGIPESLTVPAYANMAPWGNPSNCYVTGDWDYVRVRGMGIGFGINTGWDFRNIPAPFDETLQGNRTVQLQTFCNGALYYDKSYMGEAPDYPFMISAQACTNDGRCGPEAVTTGTYSNDSKDSTTPMAKSLRAFRGAQAEVQVRAQP